MKLNYIHSWNIVIKDGAALQRELAKRLVLEGGPERVRFVAGVDAAFGAKGTITLGSVVVMDCETMETVEFQSGYEPTRFPYIPGFLSFREAPLLLRLLEKVKSPVALVLVDGQGIAHPRKLGLASHIGLWIEKPTIGCAKSRLVGKYDEPDTKKGSWTTLSYKDEKIGCVLRTRDNVKPMFISPGHLVGVDEARELVMNCLGQYRLPEPTRRAHNAVAKYKTEIMGDR